MTGRLTNVIRFYLQEIGLSEAIGVSPVRTYVSPTTLEMVTEAARTRMQGSIS
jgi:hypothetical protein